MEYTVYILYCNGTKTLYVGCTLDIEKRFKLHQQGSVFSTRNKRPVVLIHTQSFSNKAEAFNRERFLKSLWGAREKKKILKRYLGNV